MDITNMPIEQLRELLVQQKAAAYDAQVALAQAQTNINVLLAEIQRKSEEAK